MKKNFVLQKKNDDLFIIRFYWSIGSDESYVSTTLEIPENQFKRLLDLENGIAQNQTIETINEEINENGKVK